MSKAREATNHIHAMSDCTDVDPIDYIGSIMETDLNPEEINLIFDFYLLHAPIRKNESEKGNGFGYRVLKEYGWVGNGGLTSLERELLKSSNMGCFVMLKADSINNTMEDMKLAEKICDKHPRAVMLMEHTVSLMEEGTVKVSGKEARLICLFRHIRNSLAHNRTYVFQDSPTIMLEDAEENGKITARIIIEARTLIEWIKIVDKNKKYYFKDSEVSSNLSEVKGA